jgi:phosphoribosylanthranilate isomerase
MKIKICCIRDAAEARIAAHDRADWFGLGGPMPSGPGVLSLEQAKGIAAASHRHSARPILLTSAEHAETILEEADFVEVAAVRHIPAPRKPVFLAGGPTPGNVGTDIRAVRPYGVDICSGARPNRKLDRVLLPTVVEEVRRAST